MGGHVGLEDIMAQTEVVVGGHDNWEDTFFSACGRIKWPEDIIAP